MGVITARNRKRTLMNPLMVNLEILPKKYPNEYVEQEQINEIGPPQRCVGS
jgi:hypothetical protein